MFECRRFTNKSFDYSDNLLFTVNDGFDTLTDDDVDKTIFRGETTISVRYILFYYGIH